MHDDRIGEYLIEEQVLTYLQDPDPFDVRRPADVWMGENGLCRDSESLKQLKAISRKSVPFDPV